MKVLVVLSGGIDSTTLLWKMVKEGNDVEAISFYYRQKHKKELFYAATQCKILGVNFDVVNLSELGLFLRGSALIDPDIKIPDGFYEEENMKQTVVPNRNMIMLSIATGIAISRKMDAVAYAAHSGDHTICPDCRVEFINAMQRAISLCDWNPPELITPFWHMTKADIIKLGHSLGVPYDKTWSCYKGGDLHCGTCGTCTERREAFLLAGVSDPTSYDPKAPSIYELLKKKEEK